MAQRTFVIAEPGSTHEGDLITMKALIDVAKRAGCDAVKFQWTSDAGRMVERRKAHGYLGAYKALQFPVAWHAMLLLACQEYNLEYMCSVYLPEDVKVIAPLVSRFKVASFEAPDGEFFWRHIGYGKPVLVSTGMMGEEDLRWYLAERSAIPSIKLLHCVSEYPTPKDQMNLGAISRYNLDGYSDHSCTEVGGALAVAVGAKIVEVHFRLTGCERTNPDFAHSLTPGELTRYVENIRWTETAMGDGVKRIMPGEAKMERYRVAV